MMNIKPLQDKVVVKPIKESETKTASGFILTKLEDEKPSEGIVVAVGPGITFDNGQTLVPDLKVGDKVAYAKYSGTEFEDHLILAYRDIVAVIEESND